MHKFIHIFLFRYILQLIMSTRYNIDEYNRNVVELYETPVLNLRQSPYRNAIIIRDLNGRRNRNDMLNELVIKLKLNDQMNNVFGLSFLHEKSPSCGDIAVVMLFRSVKRFFKMMRSQTNVNNDLCYVRIEGSAGHKVY